jgi:predicted aminopeptidase
MRRSLLLMILCLLLPGCYYVQAAKGQWEVIHKRESVEELIHDPDTPPELAARLRLMDEARDFSIAVLGLPDNKSYRTYSDLERDFVVWNVFASPEFSLTPRQWCFPVAGCVSYRGYFSEDDARSKSRRLADDGFDVAVGGVAAYSTLGHFSDPILSTMMRWDDLDLIAVLFHELAHQVVYAKGDSAFNESFATAVEEIGVQAWLRSRGEEEKMAQYLLGRELQQRLSMLVAKTRSDLEKIYESDVGAAKMREQKRDRLAVLSTDVEVQLRQSGRRISGWLVGELNNARLISTTLYEGWLPSFRAMYLRCDKNIQCFYAEASMLSDLDAEEREAALAAGNL